MTDTFFGSHNTTRHDKLNGTGTRTYSGVGTDVCCHVNKIDPSSFCGIVSYFLRCLHGFEDFTEVSVVVEDILSLLRVFD